MKKLIVTMAAALAAWLALARPQWKDADQAGAAAVVKTLPDGSRVRVDAIAPELFRIRRTKGAVWTESGMNRYDIVKRQEKCTGVAKTADGFDSAAARVTVGADGTVRLASKVSRADLAIATELTEKGGNFIVPLAKDERLYGLGDVNRKTIQRRPGRYEILVKNVNSYIPVPMTIARGGWGLFLNTTWKNTFDVGKTDPDALRCEIPEGDLDAYVFVGRDYAALLDTYTRLTGRPQLLPSFAYGFAYVCNQWIDEYEYVNEATWFNKLGLPIDIMGLEPGWMGDFYDHSTRKKWDPKRFKSFPWWSPTGEHLFSAALTRMGINMSLWMCTDYDFFGYEEQCAAGLAKKNGEKMEIAQGVPDTWIDPRCEGGKAMKQDGKTARPTSVFEWDKYLDLNKIDRKFLEEAKYPEGSQPWFRHLQKFCDQGARCWKLDGNGQVCQIVDHPDRVYKNGMHVSEAHNLYPVIYDKQMARGYEEYTGRRAMVYSAGGYAGVQNYVATWAGDTGGGEDTLVSTYNLALSGHPNQSCDMTLAKRERVHYGFLAPWSQANDWDSFHRPWTEGEEVEKWVRHYAELRYSLFPYVYGTAAASARTGYPIVCPLCFAFPDEPAYDAIKTTYLFGRDLLVSAFSDVTEVPAGVWYDWRNGKRVAGPCRDAWDQKGVWGGGLLVREGAIIPRWKDKKHLPKGWDREIEFDVWPLERDGVTTRVWYEDDGDSLGYRTGECTETEVSCETKGEKKIIRIAPRKGAFKGMPASHYVTVRIRLEKRPVTQYGTYDWYAKTFTFDLGDVDPEKGAVWEVTTADRPPTKPQRTLRDCAWMWGHDTGVYDGVARGWGIPDSEPISMPDACLKLGVPNCCGIRWSGVDYEYMKPFRKLDRFTWISGSVYNNAFTAFLEQNYMLADQYTGFVGFDFDDMFLDKVPPVKAFDREGREIRVMFSRPSYAELLAFKDRLANHVMGQRLKTRAVLYSRQIRADIAPILELVDTVLFWTWDGKDISKLRTNFAAYRRFLPTKETLLGIYMWDFGAKTPLSREIMETQLAFALEKFKAGEIQGVIFHCTPLVNKNLEAVEICRRWLEKNADVPVPRK